MATIVGPRAAFLNGLDASALSLPSTEASMPAAAMLWVPGDVPDGGNPKDIVSGLTDIGQTMNAGVPKYAAQAVDQFVFGPDPSMIRILGGVGGITDFGSLRLYAMPQCNILNVDKSARVSLASASFSDGTLGIYNGVTLVTVTVSTTWFADAANSDVIAHLISVNDKHVDYFVYNRTQDKLYHYELTEGGDWANFHFTNETAPGDSTAPFFSSSYGSLYDGFIMELSQSETPSDADKFIVEYANAAASYVNTTAGNARFPSRWLGAI